MMSKIIDAGSAKLAGVLMDFLQKVRSNKRTVEHLHWLNNLNQDVLAALVAGKFDLRTVPKAVASALEELVTTDHKIPPTLPTWFKEWEYPDLNKVGDYNSVFSAESLQRWRHDDQKIGVVTGKFLHKYMLEADLIKGSLSLRELEEIQKKGIAYFRKHFKGLAVFAWASVATNVDGRRFVPFLFEHRGGVVLDH